MKKPWKSEFLRQVGVMVGGSQVVNGLNLIYQLLLVRMLDVETFGTLNSVIALTLYFGQVTMPFQPTLARLFARYQESSKPGCISGLIKKISWLLSGFALILFMAFFLGSEFLARQQNITEPGYLIMAGILVGTAILGVVPMAFLQGLQRFGTLATLNISATFGKLLIGIALIWMGAGAAGGIAGYIANAVILTGIGYWLIMRWHTKHSSRLIKTPSPPLGPIFRYWLPTAVFLICFAALTNSDINLVKKFFSPLEAGFYSVAQIVGKIILYLPGGIAVVLFPKAAAAQAGNRSSRHLLIKGLVTTGTLALTGVILAAIFPGLLLEILTGKNNPQSVQLVFPFALAMFFYCLAWTAGFYNLSLHNMRFVPYVLVLTFLQIGTIFFHHPSLLSVIYTVAIGGLCSLVITVIFSSNPEKSGHE